MLGRKRPNSTSTGSWITTAHAADLGHPDGLFIGDDFGGTAFDDVRIYNYVLNPEEIKELYEMGDASVLNADRVDVDAKSGP